MQCQRAIMLGRRSLGKKSSSVLHQRLEQQALSCQKRINSHSNNVRCNSSTSTSIGIRSSHGTPSWKHCFWKKNTQPRSYNFYSHDKANNLLFTAKNHAYNSIPKSLSVPSSPIVAILESWTRNENTHLLSSSCIQSEIKDEETSNNPILACSTNTKTLSIEASIAKGVRRVLYSLKVWARNTWNALLLAVRGAEIGMKLSPLVILTPLTQAVTWLEHIISVSSGHSPFPKDNGSGTTKGKLLSSQLEEISWSYGLYAIQSLGPAFVKLCQWAGTRRDLFSPSVCDRFSSLYAANHVHSWKHTHESLMDAFGEDYEEKLQVDCKDVIGSGCVAQVYRGELLIPLHQQPQDREEDGSETQERRLRRKPVAVKVLHPNIAHSVERDLTFMKRAAALLDTLPFDNIKCLSLSRAVANFETIMDRQVDLRIESENLIRFRSNFYTKNENDKRKTVELAFPKPVPGFVSTNVLVEDLIANDNLCNEHDEDAAASLWNTTTTTNDATTTTTTTPISAFLSDTTPQGMQTRKELAGPLLSAFLKMIFGDNFVHCDLHPGNVYVQTTTNTTEHGEMEKRHVIYFLDAGIAASLSPQSQRNLRDLFKAVVFNDGETAGRLMVERARYETCTQKIGGVDAFAKGMSEIVSEFHNRRNNNTGLTLGAVKIGSLLARVLDLCRVHGVEIDPSMVSIVISTVVLEGLGRSLEPDLNLIDFAIPFILGRSGTGGGQF